MKKLTGLFLCLLLVSLCAFALADVTIDETNFPDEMFRNYVKESFDTDSDGALSDSEIAAADNINVDYEGITSLGGIEYFTALTKLSCYSNALTELDVSLNTMLVTLDCSYNQLTKLDVSHDTALTELYCSSNQLTELDIRHNTVLTELYCDNNQLTELDVSGDTALTKLICGGNQLTALDVSSNTALTMLSCYSNELTKLDVSGKTSLEFLDCIYNQLTELDVSGDTALSYLYCHSNQLTVLNVSGDTALIELYCEYNQLTALDVSGDTALKNLYCDDNQLTALDVSGDTALTVLTCNRNQLTVLDVSSNTALTYLSCGSNNLITLDVSRNTALTNLWCADNQLTELDISHNTKVDYLGCSNNKIKKLDIRNCPSLMQLVLNASPATREGYGFGWWEDNEYYNPIIALFVDEGTRVITGNDPIPVTSIALNKKSYTLTRTSAKTKPTVQLKATVSPENATDPSVEWSSSNPKVAKVDQKGKVTALKKGTAVITCQAKDGSGAKATCKITVKDKLVSKITLNKTKATIKKGKTLQLKVKTIKPTSAFNKKVKWTSSNKKIATVDKNGKVKALKKGTCYITCTAADGSKVKVKCKITVK